MNFLGRSVVLFVVIAAPSLGLRLRDGIELEPIEVEPVGTDAPPLVVCTDASGQQTMCDPAASTTPAPIRYAADDPAVYQITTVYNNSDAGLEVAATEEQMNLCTTMTGQAAINAGCINGSSSNNISS